GRAAGEEPAAAGFAWTGLERVAYPGDRVSVRSPCRPVEDWRMSLSRPCFQAEFRLATLAEVAWGSSRAAWLLALVVLTFPTLGRAAGPGEPTDEQVLREAKVGTDPASLLRLFRKVSELDKIIQRLGSDD